jgi:N-acetylglucosamine-6-sulfatase
VLALGTVQARVLRLTRLVVAAGMCLVLAAPASPASGLRDVDKKAAAPDIVLVLTDDQRFDTLWAMPVVQSELIARGVLFPNAFVVNSLCCPSRASILTGDYSHTTGVYSNEPPNGGFESFEDADTLPVWLQSAGYRTALIGKYLNGYEPAEGDTYIPPGWDRWVASAGGGGQTAYFDYTLSVDGALVEYGHQDGEYSTDVLAGYADSFIRETDPGQPLFLLFSSRAPHAPATPATRHADAFTDLEAWRPPSYNEPDVSDKPAWVQGLAELTEQEQAKVDAFRLEQYRALLAVDDAVETILAALEATGRLSNTFVVFASDNGIMWGEHRRQRAKQTLYEEDVRVPLVVRYDVLGLEGMEDLHLVLNIDLAPTFAELAGLDQPVVDGKSFLSLLARTGSPWRADFLIEHRQTWDPIPTYCAVRSRRFTYAKLATGEEELYDLAVDPWQLDNRAADPSYVRVRRKLRERREELCVPPPPEGRGLSRRP